MLETDEDALICDLAETYGIFNMESLPVQTVAALSAGLRGSSRIKMKMSHSAINQSDMLLATIADYLALIFWSRTKDGAKGRNRPSSIREALCNLDKKKEIEGFDTPEDFERMRQNLLSEVEHG